MSRARDFADLAGSAQGGGITGANALINGQFAVAQRATSFVAGANNDTDYTLDRWKLFSDGNNIVDVTQETTTVPTNRQYAIALDVETANKKFGIQQIVEQKNCVNLIGETVTLSFQAKVSATTNLDNVKAAIISWSGTADDPTDDMISAWGAEGTDPTLAANFTYENTPANLNLTTSYATYSVTATVDTASAKNIIVFIWSDVTATSAGEFLYLSDVKLEAGQTATPFEQRSFGDELFACQRYYSHAVAAVGPATATTSINAWATFPRQFRIAPAYSVSGALNFSDGYAADFVQSSGSAVVNTAAPDGAPAQLLTCANFSGLTAGEIMFFPRRLSNDNKIIADAEL